MSDTSHLTLLNEAFFFDSEGKRRGKYVKKNLWHPERYVLKTLSASVHKAHDRDCREYLAPGNDHYPVFDTPWGKAGFLICKSS